MPVEALKLTKNRARRTRRGLVCVVAITVAGFSVICGRTLLDIRTSEWQAARQGSANVASTINSDIARNIELYDLSLRAVTANLLLPEVQKISKELRHLVLFDRAATARHFGAIKVYDPNGKVVDDSTTLVPWTENQANADFFVVHQRNASADLFISDPTPNDRGEYAIYLSRRINKPDGSFGGVVAGSLKISYFHDLFRSLNRNSEDSFTLINRRGIVVMRIPFEMSYIGKDLSRGSGIIRTLNADSGWYERVSEVDHIKRLFVWESDRQPIFVIAGKSIKQIYANWIQEAEAIIASTLALIMIMIAMTSYLLREINQRSQLELHLAEAALTDGLTGLANRRRFDDAIASEWYRGSRDRTPLSVLMIDADDFKKYNDRYGHQAGDELLIGMAKCISENVGRAGDCASRYGGEEFAVVLPNTHEKQASEVAERIRVAVSRLPLQGISATVSIGIACAIPDSATALHDLIKLADKALYRAKASGKNCIMSDTDRGIRLAS